MVKNLENFKNVQGRHLSCFGVCLDMFPGKTPYHIIYKQAAIFRVLERENNI